MTIHKGAAAAAAVILVASGATASYFLTRASGDGGEQKPPASAGAAIRPLEAQPAAAGAPARGAPLSDVVVSLSPDAIERAGIVVALVATGGSPGDIRVPGVVEPNAYRQVVMTPLVAGRLTRVSVELGARVRRGQTLAAIYSPQLAEAQTKYLSAKAMLDAHDRELQRTNKLVEIGAASRQELERIHAEHAAQSAAVQSARSQLELLGVPATTIDTLGSGSNVDSTATVPAPIDGVVTERGANVGMNVDQATKLFSVVDLSTVWIVADVYEKDFSRVRVGTETTITTAANLGRSLRGHVGYIDPQVNPDTRTAKVRIEVPNPDGALRLGMFADVVITGASGALVPAIPRSAVQNVGDRTVVYLVNPTEPGKFTEREVRLRQVSGQQVEVESGVQPGDTVVTEGSFFIRAERERLGLRPASSSRAGPATAPPQARAAGTADIQSAKINPVAVAEPVRAGMSDRLLARARRRSV